MPTKPQTHTHRNQTHRVEGAKRETVQRPLKKKTQELAAKFTEDRISTSAAVQPGNYYVEMLTWSIGYYKKY